MSIQAGSGCTPKFFVSSAFQRRCFEIDSEQMHVYVCTMSQDATVQDPTFVVGRHAEIVPLRACLGVRMRKKQTCRRNMRRVAYAPCGQSFRV